MKICPVCMRSAPDDAEYCDTCGNDELFDVVFDVVYEQPEQLKQSQYNDDQQYKSLKKIKTFFKLSEQDKKQYNKKYFSITLDIVEDIQILDSSKLTTPIQSDIQNFVQNLSDIDSTDDFYYQKNSDNGCIITYYDGNADEVIIPKSIDGLPVDSIGEEAFFYQKTLKNIIIPDGVTNIGKGAFEGCTSLVNITIPDSVTTIGEGAFKGCTSLVNITIPDSVTTIDEEAFEGCMSLINITLPNTITKIKDNTFGCCEALTNITIPDSVVSIGSGAFGLCSSLRSIIIPQNVTIIVFNAFDGCSSLEHFSVEPDNETYSSCDNILFSKDGTELIKCLKIDESSYVIPNGVTTISAFAFQECTSLKNIIFPESISVIGGFAFAGCNALKIITIPDSVISIEGEAFCFCKSLADISIPASVKKIGQFAFKGCSEYLVIWGEPDSYACEYAKENNFKFMDKKKECFLFNKYFGGYM